MTLTKTQRKEISLEGLLADAEVMVLNIRKLIDQQKEQAEPKPVWSSAHGTVKVEPPQLDDDQASAVGQMQCKEL